MDLIVKPTEKTVQEKVSLEPKAQTIQVKHEAQKIELSDNIKKFDRKIKVHTTNPYAFNTVAKKENSIVSINQTASQMIADPLYNQVGKALGVDTLHEWGLNYDRVQEVVNLAREKSGIEDPQKLVAWIYQLLNTAPSLGGKRLNDVQVFLRMGGSSKPKVITRTIVKTVIRHVKPKETTEQFAEKFMKGLN